MDYMGQCKGRGHSPLRKSRRTCYTPTVWLACRNLGSYMCNYRLNGHCTTHRSWLKQWGVGVGLKVVSKFRCITSIVT